MQLIASNSELSLLSDRADLSSISVAVSFPKNNDLKQTGILSFLLHQAEGGLLVCGAGLWENGDYASKSLELPKIEFEGIAKNLSPVFPNTKYSLRILFTSRTHL